MVSFLLYSVLSFSCALDKQAIRQSDREQVMLQTIAQQYWDGVRWGYTQEASMFVKDPMTRALYEGQLASVGARVRYIDARVIHTEVSDESSDKNNLWLREGTVMVRTEAYGLNSVLEVQNIEQHWQRDIEGWWLKVDLEPVE